MGQLKIFENEEFGQIRTISIDGESWLVGKDVAEALGYGKGTFRGVKKLMQQKIGQKCRKKS